MRRPPAGRLEVSATVPGTSPMEKRAPPLRTYALLGASAVALQTILLREFMALFHSSELFTGAVLGGWLVFVGAGSAVGEAAAARLRPKRAFAALALLHALLATMILSAAPLVRLLPAAFGVAAGTLPSLATAVALAIAGMSVPCLLVGMSFPLTVSAISGGPHTPGRLYAWDALGAVAGGVSLAAIISLLAPDAVTIASLAGLALGGLSLLWGRACGALAWLLPGGLVSALAAVVLATPTLRGAIEKATLALTFPEEDVVAWEEAPDGRRVLTRSSGEGRNLYLGGTLVASEVDEGGAAEFAALAALAHPSPTRAAALSWPGDPMPGMFSISAPGTMIEMTLPRGGGLAERLGRGQGSRLSATYADAREGLRGVSCVDVIVYQPGMPEALLSSRLVSAEAFGEAARALAPGGVLAARLPLGTDYLNEGSRKLLASVLRAARRHFAHARLEPMPRAGAVLLASDAPLAGADEIAKRYSALETKPPDFSPDLLGSGPEREFRLGALLSDVEGAVAMPNHDLLPSAIWYSARVTGAMFGKESTFLRLEPGAWWPAALFVAIVAVSCLATTCLRRGGGPAIALARGAGLAFAAGAGGMLLEIAILFTYQVRCGALYGEVSLLLALVMAGTGAGAWRGTAAARALSSPWSRRKIAAVACALAPGAALAMGTALVPGALVRPTLWLMAIGTGFVVGAAYPVALASARPVDGRGSSADAAVPDRAARPGLVLAADLCGAGIAAALGGGLLVPVTGIAATALSGFALVGVALAAALLPPRGARGALDGVTARV